MARKTPTVRGDALVWHDGVQERTITIGTPDWFAWLDRAAVFFFDNPLGTFTACKERFQQGGRYWRAHHKSRGKLHHAYLGRSEALTSEHLKEVAAALAANAHESRVPGSPAADSRNDQEPKKTGNGAASPGTGPLAHHFEGEFDEFLLATKLLLPPARANVIPRPRLAERLADVRQSKLTLISAPAGYGKTTLLSQWARQTSCRVAWVSLDADDDDPARFWTYFIAALRGLYPDLARSALKLLHSPDTFSIESLLRVLINTLSRIPDASVVVLDDYHVIKSQVVHGGMNYLLDHLPPQIHLVIATRVDPPLALARLRGKGEMTELRAADLSFTHEEATSFLKQVMNLELSGDEVAALGERTEGWAVGLQVAGLSLRGRADKAALIKVFAGEHRHIIDYLVEEVLSRQPATIQSFLLDTSILERLTAPLCEAVTGQPGGQAMLEMLERANLFTVPLDGERRWYRYHRLFADFLRARLRQIQPERLAVLHRRASDWFAAQELLGEAVSHALAARDFDLAADLIERGSVALRKRGEVVTILAWLSSLPDEFVRRRPRLCLLHAWMLVSTSELDAAEARLKEAESGFAAGTETSPALGDEPEPLVRQRVADEVLALRAQIATYRGDWRLAIQLGRQALEHASGLEKGLGVRIRVNLGNAYWWSGDILMAGETFAQASSTAQSSGEIPGAISSLCSLASTQRVQGRLHEAARTYGQALHIASDEGIRGFLYASWPYVGLGRLRYEWNDLSGALKYAVESIQLTRDTGVPLLLLAGYALLARVEQAEGNLEGALEINEQAQRLALLHDNRRELPLLKAYQARLWLMQGNLEAASRWVRESRLSVDDPPSYEHETEHMTLAQVLTAQGNADGALELLGRLCQAAEAANRMGSVIKLLVLEAVARQARGDGEEAVMRLRRALSVAEPEGYIRTFVDRGPPVAALLLRLLQTGQCGHLTTSGHSVSRYGSSPTYGYVRSLLSAFKCEAGEPQIKTDGTATDNSGIDQLTRREHEVLQLVAAGRSVPEIALELVVTRNTIKTHLKNIYGKLDVHSATEAAAKARDLHLL